MKISSDLVIFRVDLEGIVTENLKDLFEWILLKKMQWNIYTSKAGKIGY